MHMTESDRLTKRLCMYSTNFDREERRRNDSLLISRGVERSGLHISWRAVDDKTVDQSMLMGCAGYERAWLMDGIMALYRTINYVWVTVYKPTVDILYTITNITGTSRIICNDI